MVHTYNFLENIPWGRRLGAIPTIAGSHHEKLDGTGYPRGLKGDEIRVESRMMTIADIFDALTASDRPYKKAVPLDKALDIIGFEVKDGKCDPELFRIFVESQGLAACPPGLGWRSSCARARRDGGASTPATSSGRCGGSGAGDARGRRGASGEMSLSLVRRRRAARGSIAQYADEDHATDVLVVRAGRRRCSATSSSRSRRRGGRRRRRATRSLAELVHLSVHGLVHLIGFDHATHGRGARHVRLRGQAARGGASAGAGGARARPKRAERARR